MEPSLGVKPDIYQEFIRQSIAFGLDVFCNLPVSKDCINTIFSPISTHLSLGLAYMGAAGSTKSELEKALRVPVNKQQAARAVHRLICQYKESPSIRTATRVYVSRGIGVKKGMKTLAAKGFRASIQSIDFANNKTASRIINKWVSDETNQKISNIVHPDSIGSGTTTVILNAAYFQCDWARQFNRDATRKDQFWLDEKVSVQVDMMSGCAGQFRYGKFRDLNCTALELPFKDNDFSMLILLPFKKNGLDTILANIGNVHLAPYREQMNRQFVSVSMPKFRYEFTGKLNGVLKKMGVRSMFDEAKADFRDFVDMNSQIYIDQIIHKSYICVDEGGVEATGLTPVSFQMGQEKLAFNVDRPFFFAIVSRRNRPFFFGTLRDPRQQNARCDVMPHVGSTLSVIRNASKFEF